MIDVKKFYRTPLNQNYDYAIPLWLTCLTKFTILYEDSTLIKSYQGFMI
jgi:hypothetical protein